MKHADKNEVDILLRGLAKRPRSAADVDQSDEVSHLDVDELSSYAEDALPSATRARYTAHIADCANCRQLVSSLTLSAGTPARDVVEPEPRKSFWQKFAPFFSPAVLRYAAPALALAAIIVVGLIALRQPGNSELIVQTLPSIEPTTRPDATTEKFGSSELARESQPNRNNGNVTDGVVSEPKEEAAQSNEVVTPTPTKDQAARAADASGDVAQPAYAPEPTTAPAPPPAPKSVQEKQREVDEAKVADRRVQTDEEHKERDALAKNDSAGGGIASRKLESLPAASRRADVGRNESSSADKKKAAADRKPATEEVTRSVAGRRFRRDGNSWIDTGYNQGTAVVRVSRGSEQFRALVADEPGLKTVSGELSGTVVVVWKGRVYRIQ